MSTQPPAGRPARPVDEQDPAFERLLEFLKEKRAFDFTGYRRPSLIRRVRQQMARGGLTDFDEYRDHLEVDPDEFAALFDTILINVTSFFRDAEAWDYLQNQAIPTLLEADAPIRVWSAGCATGQEAYSLAMALTVALGPAGFRERVKIYATDVDETALTRARQATYSEHEVDGLPAGYLDEYFEPVAGQYAFRNDLRRNVIFGRNDLVQDAPISRIDLLACRNTLMYLNTETQSRVVSRLGYALKPNGLLFLGKAEMLLNHGSTFEAVDLKLRVFAKTAVSRTRERMDLVAPPLHLRRPDDGDVQALLSEALLTSPVAQVIIDGQDNLALMNHRASSLLSLSERDIGRPFQDLELSYRPAELRSPLAAVAESRSAVQVRDVEWRRSASELLILDIRLVPLIDLRGRMVGTSIMFDDVSDVRRLQDELEAANRQLQTAYEELQSTNEELETTNEELQSTVEELETTNEELQSTNEELETMNEELQSMNDEFQSGNERLHDRTREITTLNRFMESILGSFGAAVIVVDRDLVIQVWSRQAEELWGLRENETVGRNLLSLDSGLPTAELGALISSVIHDGSRGGMQDTQAVNRRGRTIALQVTATPLLSESGEPGGALLLMDHNKSNDDEASQPSGPDGE